MDLLNSLKNESTLEKILKYIVVGVSILFLIFVFLSFFRVGLVSWFYNRVFDWVSVRLGFDYYPANFIALSTTAVFSAMYPYLMWTFITGRYKLQSALTVIATSGIMCLLVYTVGSDVYFDRNTGQSLKWYADTPDGRIFSDTPGFDKKYGIHLKPYTTEIARKLFAVKVSADKESTNIYHQTLLSTPSVVTQPTTVAQQPNQRTSAKLLEIQLPQDKVYFVDNLKSGQKFRYTYINGVFKHRVDTGSGKACWKTIEKPSVWSADIPGKLELMSLNGPANITLEINE